jgi:hypothetical protein
LKGVSVALRTWPNPRSLMMDEIVQLDVKARQFVFDGRASPPASRRSGKSSVRRCASLMVSMPSIDFSGLCCPNPVGHSCPASPDRLWLPGGAISDRLMFHLRIELGADQNDDD